MRKRVVIAIAWGLAGWMWASIAHVFLGTPELSLIVGPMALALSFVLLAPRQQDTSDSSAPAPSGHPGLDPQHPRS